MARDSGFKANPGDRTHFLISVPSFKSFLLPPAPPPPERINPGYRYANDHACCRERYVTLSYGALAFQTTCQLSSPPQNVLQFTADQNLLIKKDIFGAAHFPVTCQPF